MKKLLLFLCLCVTVNVQAQICHENIRVYRWTPGKGTLARYTVAVLDTCTAHGALILAGQNSLGIYTIEYAVDNDASGAVVVNMVFTGFDGQRMVHPLYTAKESERNMYSDEDDKDKKQQQQILKKIWQLYAQGMIKHALQPVNHYKVSENSVRVKENGKIFYWSLPAISSMCWCFFNWEFKTETIK